MNNFNEVCEALDRVDSSLSRTGVGELEDMGQLVAERGDLLDQIANWLQAGVSPGQEQERILRKSLHAGMTAVRQVHLTRSQLSQQLSLLTQEQRLWDALSGQSSEQHRWSVVG